MRLLLRIPYLWLLIGPTICEYFGAALNQLVMGMNDGLMPVLFPGGDLRGFKPDGVHTVITAHTHLVLFADWLNFGGFVASPGDLCIWLGLALITPCFYAWMALAIHALVESDGRN